LTEREEPNEETAEETLEENVEDKDMTQKEKKTKARLRTRGPYRKAHADW
jgi:hypothetical protein